MPQTLKPQIILMLALTFCGACTSTNPKTGPAATSAWVYPGPDGKLIYKTTPAGDRITDFSYAGYMGGGVALPDVPVKVTVKPSGGADDTATIQAAIEEVSKMPLVNGFRGAVLLAPGNFSCSKTISITTSGVVLRGSGSGDGGTTIHMTGGKHEAITIGGGRAAAAMTNVDEVGVDMAPSAAETTDAKTSITDDYVPEGATTFTVADATGFAVGDTISIRRPTTSAWIHFMGMDTLARGGREAWLRVGRDEYQQRTITAISGNKITVDIPLTDSFDAKYLNPPGTTVTKIRPVERLTQVGVEHLHIQCPPLETAYGNAPYSGVRINGDDCWVRDVYFQETMNTTTLLGRRITMEGVRITHTFPNLGASKPTDFSIEGTGAQDLIDRCEVTGDNEYFVWTAGLCPGPNVILNSVFRGHGSRIQPHMRWSTALLVDNCTVPDGGIDFANRGEAGSGHGWTMAWAVAWNCIAKTYVIQQPPGAANWAIGCIGERVRTPRYFDTAPILPEGYLDSYGKPVAPQSLYLAQLSERQGTQAVKNIGYESNTENMFPGKSTPLLPPLSVVVDPVLGPDLALHRPINTSKVSNPSRQFEGEKAVDGDTNTYWAANAGATLEVDTEGPLEINALSLEEPAGMAGRVLSYRVDGFADSKYKLLAQGTTIDGRVVDHFPSTTVWKVRLTISKSLDNPAISEFGIYYDTNSAPENAGSDQ